MTETQMVTKLVRELNKHGHFWKSADRFRAGIPDIVGCHRGRFTGIEAKIDYNTVSNIQTYTLLEIIKNGGYAGVITYNNRNKQYWIRGTGYGFREAVEHILERAAHGKNDIE